MSTIQVEWVLSAHGITKVELPTQNSNKPETVHFFFCSVKSIIVTPRGCSFFAKRQNQTNPINEISQANTSDFILKKLFCTVGRHRWLLTYYNPNQQVVYIHGSITNKWCYFFCQNTQSLVHNVHLVAKDIILVNKIYSTVQTYTISVVSI